MGGLSRCDSREDLNVPPLRRAAGCADLRRHLPRRQSGYQGARLPAGRVHRAKAEGDFRIYTATVGETVGCTLQAEIRSPAGSRAVYSGELSLPITGTLNNVHP